MAADMIGLAERGVLPDWLLRLGMRRLMDNRRRQESRDSGEREHELFRQRLQELKAGPIALHTDKANEQHYEVPAGFFEQVLGRDLKYSCAYWSNATVGLDEAERHMLSLTCERAELADGQRILELGCGWGSLTLWMARNYPGSRITAVSNSATQREFIEARARASGLKNVEVITADMNDFSSDQRFDRVVSVEMFEHMRNYRDLMQRVHDWLLPGGKLFVHIFCHRSLMYPFETEGQGNWMGKYFFTGGLMPSENTLLHFQDQLLLDDRWRVSGVHYQRTAEAWLANMDAKRDAVMAVLEETYGTRDAEIWFQRWRMFFMACAELFGFKDGTEWFVSHYRFVRPVERA